MNGVFVTGTDTGIGKTLVSAALLHALATRGVRCVGMKPISAGFVEVDGRWINDDVETLKAAGNVVVEDSLINPCALREPLAPHLAARHEGKLIDLANIRRAYASLTALADFIVVEGVGGFRVPLTDDFDTADLAVAFALPVVLVVGMRLGCLNHALLTTDAVRARGLTLAGWVANRIDPGMLSPEENIATLEELLVAPRLGTVPHFSATDNAAWRSAATHLNINSLLEGRKP